MFSDDFNIAIIKPIAKDPKKPVDTVENIRPIAISEALAHLFEKVLLNEINKQHKEADEQFGFKCESSCAHAIAVVKQLIKICNLRNKPCFICALDASKAFDKVERTRLCNKLFDEKIESAIIFSIIAYYDSLQLLVQNGNEKSEKFFTGYGVRQGGIMSPKLYKIYSNQLIKIIENGNNGISFKNFKIGIIMYADDLTLVADSSNEMQKQLDIVGKQGPEDDIMSNAKKSVILTFNLQKENYDLKLNGVDTPISNETRYLGYQLCNFKDNMAHIKNRQSKAINKKAKLKALGLISSNMSPQSRAYLYKSYIRPIIMYGIDNCDLSAQELNKIKTVEGNAIKSMVGLNKEVHTTPILNALNIEATSIRIIKDKVSLFVRLCQNALSRMISWLSMMSTQASRL